MSIADMHLDGSLCQTCGTFLSDFPEGFPQTCMDCKKSRVRKKRIGSTPVLKCAVCNYRSNVEEEHYMDGCINCVGEK